jgi:hypothetical protein
LYFLDFPHCDRTHILADIFSRETLFPDIKRAEQSKAEISVEKRVRECVCCVCVCEVVFQINISPDMAGVQHASHYFFGNEASLSHLVDYFFKTPHMGSYLSLVGSY